MVECLLDMQMTKVRFFYLPPNARLAKRQGKGLQNPDHWFKSSIVLQMPERVGCSEISPKYFRLGPNPNSGAIFI